MERVKECEKEGQCKIVRERDTHRETENARAREQERKIAREPESERARESMSGRNCKTESACAQK